MNVTPPLPLSPSCTPSHTQPHEDASFVYPDNLASPQQILIDASNGASDYGNKVGGGKGGWGGGQGEGGTGVCRWVGGGRVSMCVGWVRGCV